jgi:hypothetical protein
MADEPQHEDDLEPEEVEKQEAEPLPKREVMSLLRPPGIASIAPEPDVFPPPLPEEDLE